MSKECIINSVMVLDQFSVFTPPPPALPPLLYHPPPTPHAPLPFHVRNPVGLEGRRHSSGSRGIFFSFFLVICGNYNLNAPQRICAPPPHTPTPPPPVSIADKDNDCEVGEPSNVRQSLPSGSLLRRTQNEDWSHNNAAAATAAASLIMMILHHFCHFSKVKLVH